MCQKLKIVFLSTTDEGGGGRAAFRLFTALRSADAECRMLVQIKVHGDPAVAPISEGIRGKLTRAARYSLDSLLPLRVYPHREHGSWTTGWVPSRIQNHVAGFKPDLVHLHWTGNGFIPIQALRKFRTPLVWTIHDMWPFTGGCHYNKGCNRYEGRCGRCPQLASNHDWDLSRWVWKQKQKSWTGLNMALAAPSRWMANCIRNSSLLSHFRTEIIPNGINLSLYKPLARETARGILNLPRDKRLILFGSFGGTSDPRKGFRHLRSALRHLAESPAGVNTELITFGGASHSGAVGDELGLPLHDMGMMRDDVALAVLYSAVDVLAAPSEQDNLPNTVLEAMACGTPSVAFRIGGMPDLIDHQNTGYLANPFDAAEFAHAIEWAIADDPRRDILRKRTREKAEREFSDTFQAKRYMDLYQEVVTSQNRSAETAPQALRAMRAD